MNWYEELLVEVSSNASAQNEVVQIDDGDAYLGRDTTNGSTNCSSGNCGSNSCPVSFVPSED